MERIKQIVILMAMVLGIVLVGNAQITLPYGPWTTSVPVSQLNNNLTTLSSNALNRNGGTIAGNIAVNSGVTIDGIDISAALGGSGNPSFATITVSGTGASAIDVAGGINAGSSNVGIIGTDGRIPALSSTYFTSLNGASLTGVPASTGVTTSQQSIAFNAGNYTGGGSQTWTVDAGDVPIATYVKIGTYMMLNMYATGTDVGGTVNPALRYTVPCTINGNFTGPLTFTDAGTVGATAGTWVANDGTSYVSLYVDDSTATNWTATSGDNTRVRLFAGFNCTS